MAVTRKSQQTLASLPDLIVGNDQEIHNNLEMLAFSLDHANEDVCIIDENANIVFANNKTCELLGYRQDELLTMKFTDIAPNFEEEILVQSSLIGYNNESLIDMYFKTRQEKSFLVAVKIKPIFSAKPYFSIVVNTLIYDPLPLSKNEFKDMVETLPYIIGRFDLTYRCLYMNEACEKITGYSRIKIVKKYLGQTNCFDKDQIRLLKHDFRLVTESGLPIEFDLDLAHAISGLLVHLYVIVTPLYSAEQKVIGVMAVAQDISETKNEKEVLEDAKVKAHRNQ